MVIEMSGVYDSMESIDFGRRGYLLNCIVLEKANGTDRVARVELSFKNKTESSSNLSNDGLRPHKQENWVVLLEVTIAMLM